MAVRSGALISFGNQVLLQRGADMGAGQPNLQRQRIFEVGNWLSIGQSRGIPQVPYSLNSFDVSTDIEAILTGLAPGSVINGQVIDLADAKPFDVTNPWKSPLNGYEANTGVVVPYLLLNQASYRFGVGQSAQQQFQLTGDSIYYVTEGVPRAQTFNEAGVGPYNFANTPAVKTVEQGQDVYAYSVCVVGLDGSFTRLYAGEDYTDTTTGFTLTTAPPVGSTIHVTYASDDGPETFPQNLHASSTVKPADIQGSNINLYISDGALTPDLIRMRGVQQTEWNWSVNREPDEELGNAHYVSNDFDTPELAGSFTIRAADTDYLMARIAQFLGVSVGETANVLADVPLEMVAEIKHPDTGQVIKSLRTSDARINPPATSVQANSKFETQFTWASDTGDFEVIKGAYVS